MGSWPWDPRTMTEWQSMFVVVANAVLAERREERLARQREVEKAAQKFAMFTPKPGTV